jgi:hypothetical protein
MAFGGSPSVLPVSASNARAARSSAGPSGSFSDEPSGGTAVRSLPLGTPASLRGPVFLFLLEHVEDTLSGHPLGILIFNRVGFREQLLLSFCERDDQRYYFSFLPEGGCSE